MRPKSVFCSTTTRPLSLHREQVLTSSFDSAPVPLHVLHVSLLVIDISFSTPKAASSKVKVIEVLKLLPRTAPVREEVRPPPKNDEKISSKPPKSSPKPNPPKPDPIVGPSWPN